MDKKMLRRQIQQQRRSLTPAQIETASEQLAQQFLAHPLYKQAQSVYGYLSYQSEVSTWSLLRRIQREGKRVAVPRVVGQEMVFHWLDDLDRAQSGYHGIPEPLPTEPVADDPTALMLVPGLVFDAAGHRMGYGGGFYDRYLAAHRHPTIALCYEFQLLAHLQTEPHDIPVDVVLAAHVPTTEEFT